MEEIGFGREESFQSLIFHESKRRLHKPLLHSKYQTPPNPNTSATSLLNSKRFYHSVQLNSWLRICLRDQRNPFPLHEWLAYLTISPPVQFLPATSKSPFARRASDHFDFAHRRNSPLVFLSRHPHFFRTVSKKASALRAGFVGFKK